MTPPTTAVNASRRAPVQERSRQTVTRILDAAAASRRAVETHVQSPRWHHQNSSPKNFPSWEGCPKGGVGNT